jgi:hypothetical protein
MRVAAIMIESLVVLEDAIAEWHELKEAGGAKN